MSEDNVNTDTSATTETASPEASSGSENLIDTAAVESPVVTPTESTEMPAAWYDGLSEDVTSHKGFEGVKGKIKDVDGLTMSYLNLQSRMGSAEVGGLKAPTAESSSEELAEWYNASGRPESAGDYTFDGLPEGLELDTERLTERNAVMHAAGLSQTQYETVMDLYTQEMNLMHDNLQTNMTNVRNESEIALKQEWGTDYDRNLKSVANVAEKFGVKDALLETGLINHKAVLDMLYKVSLSTSEDGIVKNPDSGYDRKNELKTVMAQLRSLPFNHQDRPALQKRQIALSQ
jgi:hypothetical protein